MEKFVLDAAEVKPSPRQLAWQEMEFYAFAHFGVNTFTNREWGLGTEDPRIFDPSALDADQWVEAVKSAGMTGLIFTAKHHDGFCLWPSRYTDHSVKSSPWRGGAGDAVREVSEACARGGLKFGVYLSPWDRHEKCYGDSSAYNRYFVNQLTELLTEYGPVFCVWLDGACGEGPNGMRQSYDWESYYDTVRKLQPDAVISVCGPDVRWCGNEAGHCRASEWSVAPEALKDVEKIEEKSQKIDDGEFSRRVSSTDSDLGSREAIRHAGKLAWYPAEVNTSIRPGWFYHPEEDGCVKSLGELLNVYYSSVGGNANFLLNVPPDRRGLVHETDAARLGEMGAALRSAFAEDFTLDAAASASESPDGAEITVAFGGARSFDKIVLMERIASGQRIEAFTLEYEDSGRWKPFFHGTVVGYKKICRFDAVRSKAVRLRIIESRGRPAISRFGVFGIEPILYNH